MPVFLPVKLRHLECPAALGGTSIKTSREQYKDEIFPAPTRIQGKKDDKSDRVQRPNSVKWGRPRCLS